MNSGANANSESIMLLTIKYSSTAKVASHKIRSLFKQIKETLRPAFGHKFITAYKRNKNLKYPTPKHSTATDRGNLEPRTYVGKINP